MVWLFTDTSQPGGGGFYGSDWLYCKWHVDSSINKEHINIKELGMVKEALLVWTPHFRGQRLIVYSDNASTIAWLNKTGPRYAKVCMIVKDVNRLCMNSDISVNACYVPGLCHVLADSMSQLDEQGLLTYSRSKCRAYQTCHITCSYITCLACHSSFFPPRSDAGNIW